MVDRQTDEQRIPPLPLPPKSLTFVDEDGWKGLHFELEAGAHFGGGNEAKFGRRIKRRKLRVSCGHFATTTTTGF